MDRLLFVDGANLLVTVEAGINGGALEQELNTRRLHPEPLAPVPRPVDGGRMGALPGLSGSSPPAGEASRTWWPV